MKNPFKELFYPDYQRKLQDNTTQELFEAKRAYLAMQQTEQYARAQKEYHALRIKTLSDTLERLKELDHEALIASNINVSLPISTNGNIESAGQRVTLPSN